MNDENNDKYCFLWSIISSLHPCNINHPSRVSIFGQFFNELHIEGFDFTHGFKCSDVHKFEKLKNLSKNIFELNFFQDQNKWTQKLIPFEISKIEADRVLDLSIYKNHYGLIKKLNAYL